MKTIIATNEKTLKQTKFKRVSRWITIQFDCPNRVNKNNSLIYYVTDGCGYRFDEEKFDPENGLYLNYFKWNGRKYAINQFYLLDSLFLSEGRYVFTDTYKEKHYISTVDMDGDWYHPIYAEFDARGERVRIYERY